MERKLLDDTNILVRLDPDDEICAALMQVASEEHIELAKVQGLGAVKRVVMGVYNVTTQQYKANTVEGVFEMLSLTGTLDTMNEAPYSHLHIVIGDEQGHAYGGHLNEAVVSATAEIVITKLPGKIDREKSAETGLNVWKF
ncbi:PPC domain-containing DNA-binding protein [Selenomonas ruminis]|uniref:DNA-binding protein n=1 Tax=Selenomonas ruminis TaxID=2593411 RepID=A0A5D6W9C7_9FIRM|nr:PPC domain-containing DNA-binding protein [Selenomonas sp. mPRGC5]TYZ24587.1 DNA-binding protein [Selenomonas sp. mPRGC5]